jgi:hypothetical protein
MVHATASTTTKAWGRAVHSGAKAGMGSHGVGAAARRQAAHRVGEGSWRQAACGVGTGVRGQMVQSVSPLVGLGCGPLVHHPR